MVYKKITKNDLNKGYLVKTYSGSWIVDIEDGEKVLRNTEKPSVTSSLENYTDDLIDVRRFMQRDRLASISFDDILAVRICNSNQQKNNGWDYTRENIVFLTDGFEVTC